MPTAEEIIRRFDLKPLPDEGGFYRETWSLPSDTRPAGTSIFYLITPQSFSALHRLDAAEIFHFYLGDACQQIVIDAPGHIRELILGPDILAGQEVQSVVPENAWQGTRLVEGGSWALVGTTMAPGYSHDGFELATTDDLESFGPEIADIARAYLAEGA